MSAVRVAGALLRPRQATIPLLQRRFASSHSHEEHHVEEFQDTIAYPKEDFSSRSWAYFVLFGLGATAFYKFAPAPSDDTYLSRFIAHYMTPEEVWQKRAFNHLLLSVDGSQDTLLVADAKRPSVHRFRYPQKLDQASPHLHPVGQSVDFSDLVIKGDRV